MSFATFRKPGINEHIQSFAEADAFVAVVGAGASVEAKLPTWEVLVRRLLEDAAEHSSTLDLGAIDKDAWIERTIRVESLLGAVAIADALVEGKLTDLLPAALYRKGRPGNYQEGKLEDYRPGPTLHQLAHLKAAFGKDLVLITTNYDDLLEEALALRKKRKRDLVGTITPYVNPDFAPKQPMIPVFHPHGLIGRKKWGKKRPYVLTEEHYQQTEGIADLRNTKIGGQLIGTPCLFIGASLNDANLLRYIYRYTTGTYTHAVLFVRQAEFVPQAEFDYTSLVVESGDPEEAELADAVRTARHTATEARWKRRHLTPILLEHFADVAYFLHEIAYHKKVGRDAYRPLDERAQEWLTRIEGKLIRRDDPDGFRRGQQLLNHALRKALDNAIPIVRAAAQRHGKRINLKAERLAMALWLTSPDGIYITDWATTDRLHYDPTTVAPRELDPRSRWVAVKTVLNGVPHSASRNVYASRWRYVLGLPLEVWTPTDGVLPIGCLTITSMLDEKRTMLARLPNDVQAELKRSVCQNVARFLVDAASAERIDGPDFCSTCGQMVINGLP